MVYSSIPVLLLHGWGGTFEATWRAHGWVDALERAGRTVIAIDLPGHGTSAGVPNPAPEIFADLAGAIRERIAHIPVIDVVGFSLGGKIALALACSADDGGRYRRVVAAGVGANALSPERVAAPVVNALRNGVTAETPPTVRGLVEYALAAGNEPERLAAVLSRPPNPVLTAEDLKRIHQSVLLVAGEEDVIAQPVQVLADAIPSAALQMVPALDHLGLPANGLVLRQVMAFLEATAA
jgi:pimeloyl-ACP methyl ester carboxylesterase